MTRFSSIRPLWTACVLVALVFACKRPRTWDATLDGSQRQVLENWLFCDECDAGQRDSVRLLGNEAVTPLGSVLAEIPGQWITNLRSRFATAASRAQLTGTDSARYVDIHLGNFNATVQSRSGVSLADIATPAAIQTLRNALNDSTARGYRPDVIRDLKTSLARATIPALPIDYQNVAAAFLDTLWITRANAPWDGDEKATLEGAPFPNDVAVGYRVSNTQLGVVAAALPGGYSFVISGVGAQDSQYVGSLRVTSFPAAPMLFIPDVTAGPYPLVRLQSFSRSATSPDLAHYYRFAPANNLIVTATADWTGPSQIDLVWSNCLDRSPASGEPRRISGRVRDPSGAGVGGVSVTLPGTTVGAITTATGAFSIINVPAGWTGTIRAVRTGFSPATLHTWEGAADVVFVIPAPDGVTPFSEVVQATVSPTRSSLTIPGGSCRLLGVVKRDTSSAPSIVRLRVTSP